MSPTKTAYLTPTTPLVLPTVSDPYSLEEAAVATNSLRKIGPYALHAIKLQQATTTINVVPPVPLELTVLGLNSGTSMVSLWPQTSSV